MKTDAGVDPALINVIDAFLPFVSAFVIISTAVMVDRWRFGVRICAAGYGGLMGETLRLSSCSVEVHSVHSIKTDSPCCLAFVRPGHGALRQRVRDVAVLRSVLLSAYMIASLWPS